MFDKSQESKQTGDKSISAHTTPPKKFIYSASSSEQTSIDHIKPMSTGEAATFGAMKIIGSIQHLEKGPSQSGDLTESVQAPSLLESKSPQSHHLESTIAITHPEQEKDGQRDKQEILETTNDDNEKMYKKEFSELESRYDPADKEMVRVHKRQVNEMTTKHREQQEKMDNQCIDEKTDYATNNQIDQSALIAKYRQISGEFINEHEGNEKKLAKKHKLEKENINELESQEDDLIFERQQKISKQKKTWEEDGIMSISSDELQNLRKKEDELLDKERSIGDKYLKLNKKTAIYHILEDSTMLIRHEVEKYTAINDKLVRGYIRINIKHIREKMDMYVNQEQERFNLDIEHRKKERELHDTKTKATRELQDKYVINARQTAL